MRPPSLLERGDEEPAPGSTWTDRTHARTVPAPGFLAVQSLDWWPDGRGFCTAAYMSPSEAPPLARSDRAPDGEVSMSFLPHVVRATHRGGFRLHLVFNDGSENTVDLSPWLDGPVFEPLKAPSFFRRYFVDGGTVVWPNGADIAPETLYAVPGRRRPHKRLQPTRAHTRSTKSTRRASRLGD